MYLEAKPLGRDKVDYTSDAKEIHESKLSEFLSHQMCTYQSNTKILVSMRLGDTPVLIPNTKVKT